uniref:Ribonuclease H-like domain-containing protein n=1 Tax=Tanacetum cinerariifolium TaxID=118510 RepID=A0A6L2L930_TANCI|nr:ribonuclease H-like domain-containing protein [Tanacetum cinerariifolium]
MQNVSSIADYYHKLNALRKQFDAMIELPKYVCNDSESFKKHNQLMKLIEFLMGLDDSYMQIRSFILSREFLPDVRYAYTIISSEESHRVASGSISDTNIQSKVIVNGKIVDSEANQHMTNSDKELDNVYDISHLKIKVTHSNGTEAFISNIRNLKLLNGLVQCDVLVIPEYYATLISVHKLAKDNKIFVIFDETRYYFLNQDLNLKKVLGIGNQCGELYYFNNEGIDINVCNYSLISCLTQHDWHCRLGHPADPVLNILKDNIGIENKSQTEFCETYQRAKQTREPFRLSDHNSSKLGDLIHLDL